jgi:hypothetical protein
MKPRQPYISSQNDRARDRVVLLGQLEDSDLLDAQGFSSNHNLGSILQLRLRKISKAVEPPPELIHEKTHEGD